MPFTLELKNFTVFAENTFEFSDKINVLIGKNSTGKTHLLKLIAGTIKGTENITNLTQENAGKAIGQSLVGYFKPEYLGRLVKRGRGRNKTEVNFTQDDTELISFNFASNAQNNVKFVSSLDDFENYEQTKSSMLYLPPREIISIFEGFISLYQKREIAFDESYYHLALALDTPLLKGRRFEDIQKLIKPLEQITNSKVIKENGRFYMQNAQGKMEMPLVAEGYRKIATLMYLIANGELSEKSTLFWDEPEANLNPALTKHIVDVLFTLADFGVRIFIATHDYLLAHLLSLKAEYKNTITDQEIPDIKFFSLQQENDAIEVEVGKTLAEIKRNDLLDEFAAFYDLEQHYFNQTLKV